MKQYHVYIHWSANERLTVEAEDEEEAMSHVFTNFSQGVIPPTATQFSIEAVEEV